MKFVTISEEYYAVLSKDPEILFRENRRPHLLVMTLSYKGAKYNFAIPLRSNIPHSEEKNHYFALPPRAATRPGNHHGLHYIKMFPICKSAQEKFWVGDNSAYVLYQDIISKNSKKIVSACQQYLSEYEQGVRAPYSVDVDLALQRMAAFANNSE